MLKRFLFLLILPIAFISASRGPEVDYREPAIYLNMYVNDYNNRTLYYESVPIVSQDSHSNLLSLIPIIIQDTVTGEAKMQVFFSFYHSNTNVKPTIPKSMRILSHKKQMSLPIFNPNRVLESNTTLLSVNSNAPTTLNNLQNSTQQDNFTIVTSGSMFVFTDDVKKLMDLIGDTQNILSNTTTRPTSTRYSKNTPNITTQNIKFTPRKYSLSDLQERYNRNISTGIIPEYKFRDLILINHTLNNQIILTFDSGESFLLSPYYTTMLFDFMLFYSQLSTNLFDN